MIMKFVMRCDRQNTAQSFNVHKFKGLGSIRYFLKNLALIFSTDELNRLSHSKHFTLFQIIYFKYTVCSSEAVPLFLSFIIIENVS